MLKNQNNPKVLSAITDVVQGNRTNAAPATAKVNESLAARYSAFKPVVAQQKSVALQEELSSKQKKIAKVAGHKGKIDAADFKALRSGVKVEEMQKDTPGNSYNHQCALHVKHTKLGEGRTLYSQHAEPDDQGQIAWYDVMFEHGIEKRVPVDSLEIVVSESHGNHSKKA